MKSSDGKRRRGHLSDTDRELWDRVIRTLEPLPDKRRLSSNGTLSRDVAEAAGVRDNKPPAPAGKAKREKGAPAANQIRPPSPPPKPPGLPSLSGIDRQTRRRIARGTIDIDARIDLHGMTQDEAHMRLRGFLRVCQASGHRHVLVITGKGRPGPAAFGEADVRGVLKRALPHWLSHPEFRDLVAGLEEAHLAHGGSGAYYVRLRRKKGDTR